MYLVICLSDKDKNLKSTVYICHEIDLSTWINVDVSLVIGLKFNLQNSFKLAYCNIVLRWASFSLIFASSGSVETLKSKGREIIFLLPVL